MGMAHGHGVGRWGAHPMPMCHTHDDVSDSHHLFMITHANE
nr:MAG TPA: hypothetical protein [Caudoviricetes sp.]